MNSSRQNHQSSKSNLLNAASPMQNFKFDFDLGGLSAGKPVGLSNVSLKEQKSAQQQPSTQPQRSSVPLHGSRSAAHAAPVSSSSANASGAQPWSAFATSQTGGSSRGGVGGGGGGGVGGFGSGMRMNAGAGQPSLSSLSSASAHSPSHKADAFASLWTSASAAAVAPASASTTTYATPPASHQSSSSSSSSSTASFRGSHEPVKARPTVHSMDNLVDSFASLGSSIPAAGAPAGGAAGTGSKAVNGTSAYAAFPAPPLPTASAGAGAGASPSLSGASQATSFSSPPSDLFGSFTPSSAPASSSSSDPFGSFFAVPSPSPSPFPSPAPHAASATAAAASTVDFDAADLFGGFSSAAPSKTAAAAGVRAGTGAVDPLEALLFGGKNQTAAAPVEVAGEGARSSSGSGGVTDEWGLWGSDASASDGGGVVSASEMTVELEGLPPPPAGVSFQSALSKGSEFSSGGQFADAIKWLIWAEVLAGREGGREREKELVTVLKTRAKCYKEAGEMKKAVADCTKALALDPHNNSVLLQRALLFEGMEKYKAGADDLRTLTRLDPSNRSAVAILTRLNKAAASMG